MSLTVPIRNLTQLCFKKSPIFLEVRRNHWNKDYKPAPFPKTQEERDAAARKYGLLPEEYKPFPDDGSGFGDYPVLPNVSGESKDPYYPWDNPELKRNFQEPLHADFDMYGEDRYNISFKHRVSLFVQLLQFVGVLSGAFGVYYWMENMKQFPGTIPKQYPFQGKTHYTFEKAEE